MSRPDMVGNKWRKGKRPWNYGKKNVYSESTLELMAAAKLGGQLSAEHKAKIARAGIGRKHTEESKRKMALSKLGDKNPAKRKDVRAKMSLSASNPLVIDSKARKMPYSGTSIELIMRRALEMRGISFVPNHQILGKYNVDIFIEPNLVIECDGDYWHNLPRVKSKDIKRDKALKTLGYKVFRFWEKDINTDVVKCIDSVLGFD
jgi:very-short-patch-repair endonuclease